MTTTTTTWRPPSRRYYEREGATYKPFNRDITTTRGYNRPPQYPFEVTTQKVTTHQPRTRHHHHHHHQQTPKPDTCNTAYDAITIIRNEVFIFKGRYLWRVNNEGLVAGYPHEINKMWRELPRNLTHVDSVYENRKRQIVFFIGKLEDKIFKMSKLFKF